MLALVPRLRASQTGTFRSPDDAGTVIGMAHAERATDYFTQETHGHLGILAVAEDAEGRGIGRALLTVVEQWSRDAGFRSYRSDCSGHVRMKRAEVSIGAGLRQRHRILVAGVERR